MRVQSVVRDEDAVSPVIGVILMVAVTVILAAVIGTFVLGIGSQVTSDTPKVSFDFVFDDGATAGYGNPDDSVTITHRGGDTVPGSELSVNVAGATATAWTGEVSAGTTATVSDGDVSDNLTSGKKVQVIWKDSDGDGTAILGEDEVP